MSLKIYNFTFMNVLMFILIKCFVHSKWLFFCITYILQLFFSCHFLRPWLSYWNETLSRQLTAISRIAMLLHYEMCVYVCCRLQHRSVAMQWAVFWVKVRMHPMRNSSSCMRSTASGFSLSQRSHMSSQPPSLTEPLSPCSWGCREFIHSWTATSR